MHMAGTFDVLCRLSRRGLGLSFWSPGRRGAAACRRGRSDGFASGQPPVTVLQPDRPSGARRVAGLACEWERGRGVLSEAGRRDVPRVWNVCYLRGRL